MTDRQRPQFQGISTSPAGIGSVFRERPDKYMMLLTFAQEILRERAHLPAADREVIAAFTSALNGCQYCRGSHGAFARSLGADEADMTVIDSGAIEGHRLESLLAYVRALTLSPSSITEAHKQAVHDAGFSEDELKDAIAVCAAFNLFNRIVEGHGIVPLENYDADVNAINSHGFDRRY